MRAAVPDLRVGHTGALLSIDHVLVDDPDRPGARSGPCPALCFPTIDAAWEAVKAAEAALDRLAEIARGGSLMRLPRLSPWVAVAAAPLAVICHLILTAKGL